jgi:hypothetical protein
MNKANIARLIHGCRACGLFRTLANVLFDPYRPELHYMRGPGPKWRAKHLGARCRRWYANPIPSANAPCWAN